MRYKHLGIEKTCWIIVALSLGLAACSSAPDKSDEGEVVEKHVVVDEEEEVDEQRSSLSDSEVIPVGDSPMLGNPDAPVTIVEFSSMQCPHCGRVGETLQQVVHTYPDDVRVVFKHFPLRMQQQARPASIAVEAAHRQGMGYEMKSALFARLSDFRNYDMEELALEVAEYLALDLEQFQRDLHDEEVAATVEADLQLGQQLGVRGTPHLFVNGKVVRGAQPLDRFIAAVDEALDQVADLEEQGVSPSEIYVAAVEENYGDEPPTPSPPRPEPSVDVAEIEIDDHDPIIGASAEDALVTIVEFSSFQCPFCARASTTTKQLLEKYPDTVRLVYKHFPLGNQQYAQPASRASIAAGEQGKFWEMYDQIYEHQRRLSEDGILETLAEDIGLDLDQFREDFESDKTEEIIAKTLGQARSAGVRGTPTFFINGVKVTGAQPLNVFEKHIDEQAEIAEALRDETGATGNELHLAAIEKNQKEHGAAKDQQGDRIDPDDLTVGDSYAKGPEDAAVTIFEFSSFQCPFCARGAKTIKQVLDEYEGQVRLVYKNFPLPAQRHSEPASRAALAAGEQGKFWEMYELLYEHQRRLAEDKLFEELAAELGLDVDQFIEDFESDEIAAQVKSEQAEGRSVGVRGTPAYFVNGEVVKGAQPFPQFKEIIDRHLEDEK